MTDPNPYQSPQHTTYESLPVSLRPKGVWRQGDLVVMHRRSQLPDRCIVDGVPAPEPRKPVEFFTPGTQRQQQTVLIPLAESAWKLDREGEIWGQAWFGFSVLGALATPILGCGFGTIAWIVAGTLTVALLGLAIWNFYLRRPMLSIYRVTDDYIWLRGASAAFLKDLPEWPFSPE